MSAWDGTIPCHPFDDLGIVYVEVPKAGCTSIKTALARLRAAGPEPDEDVHRWLSYTWARDLGELHRWLDTRWRDYRRFTVVRDPVTRFASWYYEARSPAERYATTIDEYVARDFARDPRRLDIHAIPQTLLIGTETWRFDFVGRLEAMTDVEEQLARWTGRVVEIGHLNAGTPRPPLRRETVDRLTTIYWQDAVVLGYESVPA